MALAETFLRKANKIGLFPKLYKILPLISLLFAVASVAWLLNLPVEGQYRNTYISENALMPGQVTSYFRESEWNHVRGFREEVSKWDFNAVSEDSNPELESWLRDFGLSVSHHYDPKLNTTTMYAIMHANRGDNTEAAVLVVPYFTTDGLANYGGFSLIAALARYFSKMSIWSKNIIFVFPTDGRLTLRSWVEAYHTTLDATAGSIEVAIVLEYPSKDDHFNHMEIFYEGINGQLPNLDLFNTVCTVAQHEGIQVAIQGTSKDEIHKNDYYSRLRILATGFLRLAIAGFGPKVYGCESFSGWQIQAITVRAVEGNGPDITQMGRIVDSAFRSVNNLLEKFHQSFFFYFLLSPANFVSIGTYLPSATLIAVSFLVSSIYTLASGVALPTLIFSVPSVLLAFTTIEALCILGAFALQGSMSSFQPNDRSSEVVAVGLLLSTAVLSVLPLTRFSRKPKLSKSMSYLLLAFSLYFIAMLITSLLIVHFTLALSIGLCALPLTFVQVLINKSSQNKLWKNELKIALCLLVSSPVTVIFALGYILDDGKYDGFVHLMHSLITSWSEMQIWSWFVISLGWFPAWFSIVICSSFGDFSTRTKTD